MLLPLTTRVIGIYFLRCGPEIIQAKDRAAIGDRPEANRARRRDYSRAAQASRLSQRRAISRYRVTGERASSDQMASAAAKRPVK